MSDQQTRRDAIKLTTVGVLSGTLSGRSAMGAGADDVQAMTIEQRREKLVQCLGGSWPNPCPLQPELRETVQKDGYRIETVTYEVESGDHVPAFVLIPDGVTADKPAPAGRNEIRTF
jgi:hypothetical protein